MVFKVRSHIYENFFAALNFCSVFASESRKRFCELVKLFLLALILQRLTVSEGCFLEVDIYFAKAVF